MLKTISVRSEDFQNQASAAPKDTANNVFKVFHGFYGNLFLSKFVNGQNMGAQPLMTQVLKNDIKVIIPRDYREADPLFPLKA